MIADLSVLIPNFQAADVLDVAIVAILLYLLFLTLRETRTTFVVVGIAVLAGLYVAAISLELQLTQHLLQLVFAVSFIALIVMFHEELRGAAERFLSWRFQWRRDTGPEDPVAAAVIETLIASVTDFARDRIGTLIVIPGKDNPSRFIRGGFRLDGLLSESLLKSIFDPHSLGHDGAVLLSADRVERFACHLPLSRNSAKIGKRGTRHAAALGLSEKTDSLCLVVSEERGTISIARHGELQALNDLSHLNQVLADFYQEISPDRPHRSWAAALVRNPGFKAAAVILAIVLWFLIVPHLQVRYAAALLKGETPEDFAAVVGALEPERAATVFTHLPEDVQERFLPHLSEKARRHARDLLEYPEDSIGRIMSTQFLSLRNTIKARDAARQIRTLSKKGMPMSYAYVVNDDGVLVGVMNMHSLLVADPDAPIESVMRGDVFSLRPFTSRSDAADQLSQRRYFAVPVVDAENRMLGVIKAERLIQDAPLEMARDVQKMFGAGGDESAFSTLGYSLRKRLPWLHVNLATAFLAASVVALFEDTIARLTVLAVFLPVVAGQGGNAGAQALAVVMRGLVMREIPRTRYRRLIVKEGLLGLINGAVTGLVTAMVAWIWNGNPMLGLVVGLGMIVNLFAAGLAGASIPIGLKSLGLDPAQCSSIVLTTVTDVVGFFAFLGFAVLFVEHLV